MQKVFIVFLAAAVITGRGLSQTIVQAEYFLDSDPGVGSGTVLSIIAGDSIEFSQDISLDGIAPGIHTLFMRFKDSLNRWGLSEGRAFFLYKPLPSASLIQAEYFIDSDPGIGAGNTLNFQSGDSVQLNDSLTISNLSTGVHTLFVRLKDDSVHWGLYEGRSFYLYKPLQDPPTISSVEYFIDTDPGFGRGKSVTIAGGDSITIQDSINVASLDSGYHQLFLRTENTDNVWGLYEGRGFLFGDFAIVQLSTYDISMDTVRVGQSKDTIITITNSGSDTLRISNVVSNSSAFIAKPVTFDLLPSQSMPETLRFSPQSSATFAGTFLVFSNAPTSPDTINVSGIGALAVAVQEESSLPKNFSLEQNYPNPFNPLTVIRYQLPIRSHVALRIYNVLGQEVKTLVDEVQEVGYKMVSLNGGELPSGLYLYRLQVDRFVDTKKLMLLR